MINKVFEELRADIRKETAKYNILLFLVKNWKRSHYTILEDIINDKLAQSALLQGDRKHCIGSTISSSTLRRFFENDFTEGTVNDLRFLKTLDKLSIFMGYRDFSEYSSARERADDMNQLEIRSIPMQDIRFDDQFFVDFINEFNELEFRAFLALPQIEVTEMLHFVHENSPLYSRIKQSKMELSKKGVLLNNTEQRSNYEIYNVKKISEEENKVVYEASEFWFLQFELTTGEKYLYNKTNTQQYFFRRIAGEWKLWNNYNPNSGKIERLFNKA